MRLIAEGFTMAKSISKRISLNIVWALITASLFAMSPSQAAEITVHDVYQAAESGHLQQAQAMMQQVLREHPESAKAHYVEAELFAKSGQLDFARRELATAQRLDPTLNFAKPAALEALQARLSGPSAAARFTSGGGIPWGYVLLGLALIITVIMFIRVLTQRNAAQAVTPFSGNPSNPVYGGGYGANNYPPGYAPPAGGMGSGIVGSLATGAALGAGLVAGEAMANHFIGSGGEHHERAGDELPPPDPADGNANMGGDDFGVNDDSSWDNSGGGDIGNDWG